MDEVDVILSYPWDGHEVGERVTVDTSTAKRLVGAGVALYATTGDASAAGGDPASAATKRRKA